jgi:hypothetical protein
VYGNQNLWTPLDVRNQLSMTASPQETDTRSVSWTRHAAG